MPSPRPHDDLEAILALATAEDGELLHPVDSAFDATFTGSDPTNSGHGT